MEEERKCPICDGEAIIQGYLADLAWYKCRNCGKWSAIKREPEEEGEEEN